MNLKNVRKSKGFTQCGLAKVLKVDQSTVSKWELNVSNPSIELLKKLSKIFECTIDDLLKEPEKEAK